MARVSDLLRELIVVSEKAANIARVCLKEKELFQLLVEEKTGSNKNHRFVHDFKTLADVLVQETIRYDLSQKFEGISKNIRGEESNQFTNALGENITVEVKGTEDETSNLLLKVLDGNESAAKLLARAVHTTPDIEIQELDIPEEFELDVEQIGIWIDPIDSTQEYVKGKFEAADKYPFPTAGLYCVTCLIGVYCLKSGQPLIGIVNQPFHSLVGEDEYKGKCYWGFDLNGYRLDNFELHDTTSNSVNTVLVSGTESAEILDKLATNYEYVVQTVGAGYKVLCVATRCAVSFVTSKGSTYKWDTCAPHAILKALGGNLVDCTLISRLNANVDYELIARNEIRYDKHNDDDSQGAEKWANKSGLIAFRDMSGLKKVLDCLRSQQSTD